MRNLSPADARTLEKLCALSQKGVKKTMSTYLHSKYKKVIETDAYILAEGDIPIMVCAHLDTVAPQPPKELFYDRTKNVMWAQYGPAGFDDRAGVFAIIQLIRSGLRPHIALLTDEEIGALGASQLIEDYKEHPFAQLQYIIELDRRGEDAVFYECDNPEFIDYVEKFGFAFGYGSFSDISVICDGWGIAGVNLGTGYAEEHSPSEILYVGHMLNTIDKVSKMLMEKDIPYFEYIPMVTAGANWWKWLRPKEDKNHCYLCGHQFEETSMIPVRMIDRKVQNFCIDCTVDNVKWCQRCGEAYEPIEGAIVELCNDCREEVFCRANSKSV